ncbi:MAG: hypothetical protein A2015_01385 [Spirochaetes bacterium GWF1_31_7]|nr:MAG: hypothetical protein A2Y30_07975 [Spirochaetes bacterium GWE1_32_154]OHD47846.1 MAG: hypothetical protein A2015_01385 [Spirochaetes bacterium GWF1_31_7]OHD52207.1 MAG: hypothetical protein A2Y29_17620 [Spirochaetes bacterium GWE2_31_10]OHD79338.1 MAG: hypothetical protein A2355_04025 [Spirochaetes bacterium RIFOXYB1_FULL_32_8]HBD96375.1 hypothetical protein [Spirochaetia bacterium]
MSIGAAENIIVRDNILISNDSSGISSYISIVDANKPSRNINITDNTFVARNSQYTGNKFEMSGLINVFSNVTKVSNPFTYTNHQSINISNNIFYIYGESYGSRFFYVNNINEVLPQVKSDNNLFFVSKGTSDGEFFQIGDAASDTPTAQYLTLQQWQTANSQDTSSIYADPEFVNLLGTDGAFSGFGYDADLRLIKANGKGAFSD